MSLMNSEDKRSYSTLNLFFFVLKFFFERKKSSINMSINSHSVFRLAEMGSKMNSLLCGNTLCYEMYFNHFRFQLNEELGLLFDHGNRAVLKKTWEMQGKIMQKVFLNKRNTTKRNTICRVIMLWVVIRNDFILVKKPLIFYTIWWSSWFW